MNGTRMPGGEPAMTTAREQSQNLPRETTAGTPPEPTRGPLSIEEAPDPKSVTAFLSDRHPAFALETIERLVTRAFEEYREAPDQVCVPLLVRRELDRRLSDLDYDFARRVRRS
jgi:hypothetical protein